MKIKEVSSKAEKLIEVGKEVEARRNSAMNNVQSAHQRIASAQYELDRASETDENGDTVGDVGAAQADLDAAYMDLEYYEEELDAAEAELESINAEKYETIHTLDEYNEGESGNLSIIKQLQAKTFGGNVAAMAAAIIGQMNLAESTKADLYNSMGMKYTARRNGVASGNGSSGTSNGGMWKTIDGEHSSTFDLKKTNPNYAPGTQWSVNCQRCVPTYEMRRRGYDVTAKPCPPNDGLSRSPFSVWKSPDVVQCKGVSAVKNKMKEWGDGARAQVVVVWGNTMNGHTFVAEQKNGETVFLEPQVPGDAGKNVEYYFDMADPDRTWICRIDNLETTEKITDCCKEA